MRKDYKSVNDISLATQKNYLLKVCHNEELKDLLYDCMTHKQFQKLLNEKKINNLLYIHALHALYKSSDYEELEYHLVMMNSLFHYQSYTDLKKQLFQKISKKSITINEYCVIRHLIRFQNISFCDMISVLSKHYEVSDEECARICLLEDEYHLAYKYLRKLDECQDETLLDLLCSYSIYDYTSLMMHYAKCKRDYQLMPSH